LVAAVSLVTMTSFVGCGGGHTDVFSHCGNGMIDTQFEECDDGEANDDHGSCLTTCLVERCGDGFQFIASPESMQESEECDGQDFGGQTCQSFGFASGTLVCNSSCNVDLSECVP
jgi:hypothetical protein